MFNKNCMSHDQDTNSYTEEAAQGEKFYKKLCAIQRIQNMNATRRSTSYDGLKIQSMDIIFIIMNQKEREKETSENFFQTANYFLTISFLPTNLFNKFGTFFIVVVYFQSTTRFSLRGFTSH